MGRGAGIQGSSFGGACGMTRLIMALALSMAAALTAAPAQAAHHGKQAHRHHHRVAHAAAPRVSRTAPITFDDRYSAILMDAVSGRVLHEQDADERRFPASLTKMMTLYLTFEAIEEGRISFQSQIPVSAYAAQQAPTKLGLRPGQTLSVREAVLGLITKSANDAACALAETLGGSEARFAEMMTRKARDLGMAQTLYRNASGLPDPEQHTTARDQATLALHLQRDFPQQYPLFATAEFRFRGAVHPNHNHLLKMYEGTDGLKTGFINASGFNLAASARRDGHRVIGVVFGGPTSNARDRRMVQLLDHGFAVLEGRAETLVAVRQIHNPVTAAMAAAAAETETAEGDAADEAPRPARAAKAAPAKAAKAKAEPTRVAAAPANPGAGGWGVQVGAFRSQTAARAQINLARKAAPTLGQARFAVVPDRARKPRNHKARFLGLTADEAERTCKVLRGRSMPCVTVAPENDQDG